MTSDCVSWVFSEWYNKYPTNFHPANENRLNRSEFSSQIFSICYSIHGGQSSGRSYVSCSEPQAGLQIHSWSTDAAAQCSRQPSISARAQAECTQQPWAKEVGESEWIAKFSQLKLKHQPRLRDRFDKQNNWGDIAQFSSCFKDTKI